MPTLRAFQEEDLDQLYAISLATGFEGGDARHLYSDGQLIGHVYSAPYACLEPSLCLVAEDEKGIIGFALGAIDTIDWEKRLEREWWPDLRKRYPDPSGAPETWTADQRRCAMIHHPERTPVHVASRYPAQMHLNLVAQHQGKGLGPRLLQAWLKLAVACGARGIHVGVNRANQRAIRFWSRHGFEPLSEDGAIPRTVWMGRSLI